MNTYRINIYLRGGHYVGGDVHSPATSAKEVRASLVHSKKITFTTTDGQFVQVHERAVDAINIFRKE